ncbi:MAG: TetR/AcrR family transcriptional regulator [Telmatospirillum sp.]|nr:TetR/AcrR family transcriptional regulator [Telmatospirillum sp.]
MAGIRREGMRGRPRAFDESKFLDGAIALFSGAGYTGVGISDLTEATGLTTGSIYKAYQDKEGVFARALERYIALGDARVAALLEPEPDARARIAALLRLYVSLSQGRDGRLGCLVVTGMTGLDQVGRAGDLLRSQLSARRRMLAALIAEGQRDGSLGTGVDPRSSADVLLALLQGMRVMGKAGTLTEDSDAFISQALKILD